jgi:hypothetical protein
MLSFANVYFLESGLFNGLQPIQIKKSSPVILDLESYDRVLPQLHPPTARGFDPANESCSTDSDYRKENV